MKELGLKKRITGWWFYIFSVFTRIFSGNDAISRAFFSDGFVQPPPRLRKRWIRHGGCVTPKSFQWSQFLAFPQPTKNQGKFFGLEILEISLNPLGEVDLPCSLAKLLRGPERCRKEKALTLVESSSEPCLENWQRSCEEQNGWRVCSFHSDFYCLGWDNSSLPNVELNVKSSTTLVGPARGSFLFFVFSGANISCWVSWGTMILGAGLGALGGFCVLHFCMALEFEQMSSQGEDARKIWGSMATVGKLLRINAGKTQRLCHSCQRCQTSKLSA